MTAEALEWSYNPWRDRPGRATAGVAAALACCVVVASLRLGGVATLALCVVCVASLGMAFVPVRCRLDDGGITRRSGWFAERRPWSQILRAVRTPDGVLLSPFQRRHWLDPYRALFLPLPPGPGAPPAGDLERILTHHGL